VLFPGIFSGYLFHLKTPQAAEGYARAMGFPYPQVAGVPAGLWLVVASLSIALGVYPDIGSLMIAAFMIPTAWYFHGFWRLEDPQQKQMQMMLFFRNVITFASALIMFAFFAVFDEALRFALTGSVIDLR
jgi:uncharacterized membrane protein YphA (DoxX/SURF4 family)